MVNKTVSDYLIIGSGLAGLYAAHCASKYGTVAILTKHFVKTSSSFWAQGGIATAMDEDDSPEIHFDDTIKAGRGLCNLEAVKILVNEGPKRINELASEGLNFDQVDSKYSLGLEGGHSRRRILHLGGIETGRLIVEFLINEINKSEKIKIFENFLVHKLIVNDGNCCGAFAFDWQNGQDYTFNSKIVVIASGGAAGIFKRSTNPESSTGDGITLAFNAGVRIANMEFIQFHPTAFYTEKGSTFLLSEALRGEGGYLLNNAGDRFMKNYHESAELAPRDVVAKAIHSEMEREGVDHLFLSLSHLNNTKLSKRFIYLYNKAKEYNIDITSDKIPIAPAAHYTIGGVDSSLHGESSVKKLFVTGEVAHTGVHGANRLASNSLLECIVFSYRAIEKSRKYLSSKIQIENLSLDYYVNDKYESNYLQLKKYILGIMNDNTGIVRSSDSLSHAKSMIEKVDKNWDYKENEYYSDRLKSLKTVAQLIISGGLERRETRGSHFRLDYPDKSEKAYDIYQSLENGIKRKYIYEHK
jgi:L-aspartate oxidase